MNIKNNIGEQCDSPEEFEEVQGKTGDSSYDQGFPDKCRRFDKLRIKVFPANKNKKHGK